MFMLYLLLLGVPLILLIIKKLYYEVPVREKNVCIVVLGDIGRSPRMQYHALSFAKEGFKVDVVGYYETPPLQQLRSSNNVKFYYLRPPPQLNKYFSQLLFYGIKTIWQASTLVWVLFKKQKSDYLLMQNPPAIPSIPICWFYCMIVRARFAIDWHNYAHSLMALTLKEDHLLVKIAKNVETFFGSRASNNFCVTTAMQKDLLAKWNISANVLYDRPADEFQPLSLEEKHKFILKLSKDYDIFSSNEPQSTIFTKCVSDTEICLSPKRPGLIISSTSWTEDENFSILLNALQEYENALKEKKQKLPELVCVITGKGPLKDFYTALIKLKKWKYITIITPWLESEDYPKMLACADLGISLHTSSSGLDLPMKVIDMYGCTLPVCAYNFNCLSELVKHKENGFVFSSDKQLAEQLKFWFEDFPNNPVQREMDIKFKEELNKFQETRWHGNWLSNVLPFFKQ